MDAPCTKQLFFHKRKIAKKIPAKAGITLIENYYYEVFFVFVFVLVPAVFVTVLVSLTGAIVVVDVVSTLVLLSTFVTSKLAASTTSPVIFTIFVSGTPTSLTFTSFSKWPIAAAL